MDGGGGGRGYYRGRGRGRNRNHRGGRGGRGGRGSYRHQPYNNRSRYNNNNGGRGSGRPGNRFGAGSLVVQDPQAVMIQQVFSFVSRVGEFKNIRDSVEPDSEGPQLRPVEATTAGNINDLVAALCSEDKLDMLFKCQQSNTSIVKPEDRIGKLGHLVISCAASLPLQTPCYAALTLAVNEQIKGSQWKGFAVRCVECAVHYFVMDLDMILRTGNNVAQSACRMKLLLRYLAILGKIGVVKGYEEGSDHTSDSNKLTVFGLLSMLVETAKIAQERDTPDTVAHLFITLVLSTVPYVMEYVPQAAIGEWIINPIDALLQTYKSPFIPGTGCTSILLEKEQDDGDSEDEDDDDDEEDDDDNSGQVCDSLQDLLRVSKNLNGPSRFALPLDSPWKGLTQRINSNEETGETEVRPVSFSDETIYLSVQGCGSLRYLLVGEGEFKIVPFSLDGVIFGRLPIFGSPSDPDDEELESNHGASKNEELDAFKERFSLLDRFFVADVLRDCLISFETSVNPTGLQLGSPKSVAEELLSVHHIFSGDNSSQGMAYAVVETLFGLVAQSREQGRIKHIYISRVLLELTRLHPQLISPSLAVAMTNLFEDYMPALVPTARDNISRWFAFHLINTDYQWPSAYWQLLEPYATSANLSSRGGFARRAIQVMVENVTDPSIVVIECLSSAKSLANECFPRKKILVAQHFEESAVCKFEVEIDKRVWDQDENPAVLEEYLLGEELSSSLTGVKDHWVKTKALVRVLMSPVKKIQKDLTDALSKNKEDKIFDDTFESKDCYMLVANAIEKYSKIIIVILAKEAEQDGDITHGESSILGEVEVIAYFNANILRGLINCFLISSVVEGSSVVRWALNDLGGEADVDIVSRWWVFAIDALQQSTYSVGGIDGMIVDGSAAETSDTGAREKMLTYTVKRVCSLLATKNEERLDPMQVDLLEGMKSVALRAKCIGSGTNMSSLADLCSGFGGSMAVEQLKSSLIQL
mmetsp:Transcript_8494/g.9115  ORF Transcript_8494/g.9115 Transcript_8494/m.9115 type:complete len:984 (+) Transcript_8494:60-3011(+)